MEDKRKEIGWRILQIRERMKLSQNDFGELAGVSGSAISAYEKGDIWPSVGVLIRIADISCSTVGWLAMGSDAAQDTLEKLLSKEDVKLLDAFHRANEEDKKVILRIAEAMAETRKKKV